MTFENEQEPTPEELKRARYAGIYIAAAFIISLLIWVFLIWLVV